MIALGLAQQLSRIRKIYHCYFRVAARYLFRGIRYTTVGVPSDELNDMIWDNPGGSRRPNERVTAIPHGG
jgi:hypothetical protein